MTAVPENIFKANKFGELKTPPKVLYGPGHYILDVKGCFQCVLSAKGHSSIQDVYGVNKLTKSLLGLPAIEALNLVHQTDTVTQHDINYIVVQSVFSGLELMNDPYHIELKTQLK